MTLKSLLNDKIVVVSNDNNINRKNLFCPVCEYPAKSLEDSIALRKSGCCNLCDLRFGTPIKDKWNLKEGVYPKKDSEEWLEYVEIKQLSCKTIFNFK